MENNSNRFTGTVKEFSVSRHMGYIEMDGHAEPVLVRYSAILGAGIRTLRAGQRVSFELEVGQSGLSALRVITEKS